MEDYTGNFKIFLNALDVLGYSYGMGSRNVDISFNIEFYNFHIKKDDFNFQLPDVLINNNRNELMEARWEQLFSVAALNKGLAKEPDETNLDFAKRIIKGRNSISMKWQSCAIL